MIILNFFFFNEREFHRVTQAREKQAGSGLWSSWQYKEGSSRRAGGGWMEPEKTSGSIMNDHPAWIIPLPNSKKEATSPSDQQPWNKACVSLVFLYFVLWLLSGLYTTEPTSFPFISIPPNFSYFLLPFPCLLLFFLISLFFNEWGHETKVILHSPYRLPFSSSTNAPHAWRGSVWMIMSFDTNWNSSMQRVYTSKRNLI